MLKEAKRTSLRVGKMCGLFGLSANSRRRRSRLLILGYHGVSLEDEHLWRPALYLSPQTFRTRMEALRKSRCNVLTLDEALRLLYEGELPDRAVVLTFDDGTYDFHKVVCPVLKEYGYPATLYLTTEWVKLARPVVPVIWSYLLWKARGQTWRSPKILGSSAQLDLSTEETQNKALEAIVAAARASELQGFDLDAITRELAEIFGVDYETVRQKRLLQLLRPEEIHAVSDAGVSIQLHMHRHNSPDEEHDFKRNLSENRGVIADLLGSSPYHFCYPSGYYKTKFFPWLRDLGIQSATTCDPGLANARTDRLQVPRLIDTSNLSPLEFESWLVGIGELLPRRAVTSTRAV